MNEDDLVTITLRRSHLNTLKICVFAFLSMFGGNLASLAVQVAKGEHPELTEKAVHELCDDHERVKSKDPSNS